jgi:DNA-binding LytR/AlgR family response regulator
VLSYAGAAALFWDRAWLARRLKGTPAVCRPRLEVFEIRDGARTLRPSMSDILAVQSAGNYVEVLLADGRRPLTP